jgi:hypothetical protein
MFVLEAEFVFLLAVGTQIVKAAQPTLFLVIFSSLQVRFRVRRAAAVFCESLS